ncbi:MAG: ATP-dependent helicase, partial [Alphaproteobacteria bacterium]
RARSMPMMAAAGALVDTDELKPRARNALRLLLDDFARWRSLADATTHGDLAGQVLDESGYTEMWKNEKTPDAPGRLENLKELVRAIEEFENLAGFLEHVSLVMEAVEESGGDMVNLMTLHSAKGLEFDTVFLPGWEEGLFPHQRALDEGGLKSLEEERRLAYVGITRARKRVRISFAANRRIHNQWQSAIPSRFVDELPADHVEVQTDTGLYGGGGERGLRESGSDFHTPTPRAARGGLGPGNWRHAGTNGGRPRGHRDGLLIEGDARAAVPAEDNGRFSPGARVFHQKFGYGTVTASDGDKLRINFDHTGEKKVMDSFVEPA